MIRHLEMTMHPTHHLTHTFPYPARPWNARKFVAELERRSLDVQAFLAEFGWQDIIPAFEHGKSLDRALRVPADPALAHHLQMCGQEMAVHHLWNRGGRVVLDIDPGMTGHLRASGSDKFPPMVLKNLTHTNPLVFLGSQVGLRDSANKPLRLLGWYAVGSRDRQYVDTTDERANAFHLTAVAEVMSKDGKQVIDWDHTRITLPVTGAEATVDEIVQTGLDGFAWDPTIKGQDRAYQVQFIAGLLHVIVPHMLYLVSQNLESKPKPFTSPAPPRRHKWDKKQGGGQVDAHLVGWRSGPVLASVTAWGDEEVEPRDPRGSQGSRRAPGAHVRRAHFHTYWAGKGFKEMTPEQREQHAEKRVKWLPPIPVNADSEALVKPTTAVKVR